MKTPELSLLTLLSVISFVYSQDDGWSSWSEQSECSRTCGIGVTSQTRRCNNLSPAGVPQCSGPSKIYKTCSKQPCPEGTDFRKEQCERYNDVTFEGKLYTWVPYYGGKNPCELNCLAVGEKFYYRHAAKVIDGTACGLKTQDVCVDGVCQQLGCDGELSSTLLWDKCHVCGGDGSSCQTLEGVVYSDSMKIGYNDVVLIPAGATSISVIEEKASDSYLALRDLQGTYHLNGDWHIDLPLPKIIAGATFEYERGSNPTAAPETLKSLGPTTEALFLVVLRQPRNNTAIRYEFSIPGDVKQDSRDTYIWETNSWQSCSATCGTGTQRRQVMCKRASDMGVVAPDLCDPHRKPTEQQECKLRDCTASWHTGDWGTCSTTCEKGYQTRPVYCRQQRGQDLHTIVDNALCQQTRPSSTQICNENIPCPRWDVGNWSKCNRVCGEGEQVRSVICRSPVPLPNTASDIMPDTRCEGAPKPATRQACNMGPCEGLDWVVSDWSGCSVSCDVTTETRHVVCSSKTLELYKEEMCDLTRKPTTSRPCPQSLDCVHSARWHSSQWSKCSAKCGMGLQFRQVLCARQEGNVLVKVDESNCNPGDRMLSTQECSGQNCTGMWFTGPWGKCSEPCGGGLRKREVMCFSASGGAASTNDCSPNLRPDATQDCNLTPCDEDNLMIVGGCKGTRHGCCPDGITAAEGPNYMNCPVKDPIPTGLCVEAEFGCCLDGVTPAQGPFLAGCPYYTCKATRYGCCADGQTPAGGPNGEECPVEYGCEATAYGCCDDGISPANGYNKQGCEQTQACRTTVYGCCLDGVTAAEGPEYAGCDMIVSSGEICEDTQFGCCADGITPAKGYNDAGCNEIAGCSGSQYGCCPDGISPAKGVNYLGCQGVISEPQPPGCAYTVYGCCPDGEMAALGPNEEGCHGIINVDCATTTFGCCPDQETIALGPNMEGCSTGCEYTRFGCCQDGKTPSLGPNYDGCDDVIIMSRCEQTEHGCCPDRLTAAKGPNYAGCNITRIEAQCDITTHGCCPDGHAVAAGPNFEGCSEEGTYELSCNDTPFGCCSDQVTPAQGPNEAGCPTITHRSASCGLTSETGPCRNFSVKWFYDPAVGDCSRFWYGGCDGNKNRFESQEQCKASCISPPGLGKCYLPKSVGRCQASTLKYFYNHNMQACEQFSYGGCQGNDNRFDTEEQCQQECIQPHTPDVCSQPPLSGPCRGSFPRWHYNKAAGQCQHFTYGGCKGNDNRFDSKENCEARCMQSSTQVCTLPKETGPCRARIENWYFNTESKECEQFVYGGCQGNANRFPTREECESTCQQFRVAKKVDICQQPMDAGPCKSYQQRWYYNPTTGYCQQFVYGGCQGNGNRFETEAACRQQCNARPPVDVCTLPSDRGSCADYTEQYYFDQAEGQCRLFYYGGCEGNGNRFVTEEECSKTCAHHVTSTTTRAPTHGDRCHQGKDPGPCLAYLVRWYYDSEVQQCRQFIYGGCQGNRNRFMKMDECQAACMANIEEESTPYPDTQQKVNTEVCSQPRATGSCAESINRWYYDNKEQRCVQFIYGGCEGNDNRFETKADCERMCSREDICNLEHQTGPCRAYFPSWYYDKERQRCERFIYGGCGGNDNRFETEDECRRRCDGVERETRPQPTEPVTPQPTQTPQPAQPTQPTAVPITGVAVCALVTETGPCRASQARWTFDIEEGRCKEFVYGGCRGNENNFITRDECEATCQLQEICQLPYETGPCRAAKRRYFYDVSNGQCRPFTYGGCQGNANRFLTEKSCESACMREAGQEQPVETPAPETPAPQTPAPQTPVPQTPVPQPPDTRVSEDTDVCKQPYDTGPCEGYNIKYYFETRVNRCHRFVYGGCGGNSNRFETLAECKQLCEGGERDQPVTSPVFVDAETTTRVPAVVHTERVTDSQTIAPTRAPVWVPTEQPTHTSHKDGRPDDRNIPFTQVPVVTQLPTLAPTTLPQPIYTPPPRAEVEVPQPPFDSEDVCQTTKDPGDCDDYTPVWYFEPNTRTCRRFLYGGCGGNDNRFNDRDSCEARCLGKQLPVQPEQPNPQPEQPRPQPEQPRPQPEQPRPQPTSRPEPPTQPPVTRALVTQPPVTSPPHPGDEEVIVEFDVCDQQVDRGTCNDNVVKWFYDVDSNQCSMFNYSGCAGNANRFDNVEECELICVYRDHQVRPQANVICTLPPQQGPCNETMQLWYYNPYNQTCLSFTFGGCFGNKNRFQSQEICMSTCEGVSKKTHTDAQHSTTTIYSTTSQTTIAIQNTTKHRNELNTITTSLITTEGIVTPATSKIPRTFDDDICSLPKEVGPCKAFQARWHFDGLLGRCIQFNYGGCNSNANNFLTAEECRYTCGGQEVYPEHETTDALCRAPRDPGPCYADLLRYFFDHELRECRPFIYGGCQGNSNNFESADECYDRCGIPEPDRNIKMPGDCFSPPDAGPCDNAVPRWFFDPSTGECSAFYYGGCQGNGNNFHSYEDCVAMCSKVTLTCGVLQCDLHCPQGYASDVDGCPICSCQDPCTNVKCPDGEQCEFANERAVCKPIPEKQGACPSVDRFRVASCIADCQSDNDCLSTFKCCSNGCGFTCVEPSQPAVDTETQSTTVLTKVASKDRYQRVLDERLETSPALKTPTTLNTQTEQYVPHAVTTTVETQNDTESSNKTQSQSYILVNVSDTHSNTREANETDLLSYTTAANESDLLLSTTEASDTINSVFNSNITTQTTKGPMIPKLVQVALCPETSSFNVTDTNCVADCSVDDHCGPESLCCFDGCALSCMSPVYVQASIFPTDDHTIKTSPGCANTVYGCCPDGVSPANDYNYRGCPEEAPVIEALDTEDMRVRLDEDVILPCKARGAPRPQISWYKDNFPITNIERSEHFSQMGDGSLHIKGVTTELATVYTCRAYNGVGSPAIKTYSVQLEEDIGFLDTPSEVTVRLGETAHLFCEVRGNPPPQRRWLHDGQPLESTGQSRVLVRDQRELIIMQVTQADQGEYVCQASNEDLVITKNYKLNVLEPLSVSIEAHNGTYGVGDEITLECLASGEGDIHIRWSKVDSEDFVHNPRFSQTLDGTLSIRSASEGDAGMYKCSVTRGQEVVSASTVVRIEAGRLPENCVDKPWLANCQLIIEARLCKHPYFSNFCCRSCHEAGHLP